jgi:2-polyprenyl-3-methyl-5-hydroxy-6-metoxy-1,4-benzoquinol methylase
MLTGFISCYYDALGGKHGMTWSDFWQYGNFFERHLKTNARILFLNITTLFGFKKEDVVLDIGCASGYFLEHVYPNVKEIYGVDISPSYIAACKRTFTDQPHAHFFELDPIEYTDLSFLPASRFTKVICSGVIHYYRDISEVMSLIKNVKRICTSNASFIISDIIDTPQTITVKNLYSTFWGAFKEHRFLDMVWLYLNLLLRPSYRKAYQRHGHLYLNYTDLIALCDQLNVKITKIATPSISSHRLSICVTFPDIQR